MPRLFASLVCFVLMFGGAAARAAELNVYPVPLVFLPSDPPLSAEAQAAIPTDESGELFADQFRLAFPDAATSLKGQTLGKTFVASLRVSRASTYLVRKLDGNVDAYAAVTGTVRFFDLTTGQILQSYTTTKYVQKRFSQDPEQGQRIGLLRAAFTDLTTALIGEAKGSFKPYAIAATVRRSNGDLVILDQGIAAGIGNGDELTAADGSGLQVSLSSTGYAAALKTLGTPKTGASYSRFANRPLAELQRPRAMLIPEMASAPPGEQAGFSPEALGQMFIDGLGARSPFNIIEFAPEYLSLRDFVERDQGVANVDLRARVLPNYFIRLTVTPPIAYAAPTNLSYVTRQTIAARAQAEVLNASGRIVFAASGENIIADDVTDGVGFDLGARTEIAEKNAVTDLAAQIAGAARFESFDLPIRSISGDSLTVEDAPGVLTVGSSPNALSDVGHIDGIQGSVLAPTWQAHIDQEQGDNAAASLVHPALFDGAPPMRAGDLLRVDRFAPGGGRNTRKFKPCGSDVSLGAIKLDGFNNEAMVVFASRSGQETYDPGVFATASADLNGSGDFKKRLSEMGVEPDLCVEPVQHIDLSSELCDGAGVCKSRISLKLTYRILKGETVVFRSGLETTVDSSSYLQSIQSDDKKALIDADLTREAVKLLGQIVDQPSFKAGVAGL
jgi:hypothetical protein